jgi:hypothetical protein
MEHALQLQQHTWVEAKLCNPETGIT